MDEFKLKFISLHHRSSWSSIYHYLKKDPHMKTSLSAAFSERDHKLLFPNKSSLEKTIEKIRQYEKNGIHSITIFDPEYPPLLKEIYQPPWVIYAKGDISFLHIDPKLAVVGSRQITGYGRSAIRKVFPGLMEKGVLIVSGLAAGADAEAHEAAISLGGRTIGVIAGGLNHIYPKSNVQLAKRMMEDQLVLSEYPPDVRPDRWQSPMRNRIISGLSQGTFIIEAKSKSGSLITANYAVNEGRDVFALPGSIFSPASAGTNELIQQGAKLIANASEILEELKF
jgi:DNA processing protein